MVENEKKDVDEKVENFMQEFHGHGMGCGTKIAELAKEIHPGAIAIIPLYRSCIVIEQDVGDKKEGDCMIHTYADPHWLGKEITIGDLKSEDFHSVYHVQGDRQGPMIVQDSGRKR